MNSVLEEPVRASRTRTRVLLGKDMRTRDAIADSARSNHQVQAIHPLPFWTTIQTAVFLGSRVMRPCAYFIKPRKIERPRASVSSFAANDNRKCVSRVEKTLPGITSTLCSIARSTNWVAVIPSAGGTSTNA